MNANKTCLAILLGLLAVNAKAETSTQSTGALSHPAISASATSGRLFNAILPGNIIYWRAASFTPATNWNDLADQTNVGTAKGLILDLRSNTSPADALGASSVANLLTKGQKSPMLVVLTNHETRGAAEALAASLQAQGALIMGEKTAGNTAHAVVPDVTTTANSQNENAALALIDSHQVGVVITEPAARQRMSEAALVKGQDPEQDAFIASHEHAAPAAMKTATHDIALVEALDSFKAIRVLQGEESSPQPRVADASSTAGLTVIASSGLR